MHHEQTSKSPLFSIITICLDSHNIDATCRSITHQTFDNFEWIVIDGGSRKETLDILNSYGWRMKYFVSEKDNGIYHAMNKGILQSQGAYLHFMNGGDKFYNMDVLNSVAHFIKQDSSDIIYGNTHFESPKNIIIRPDVGDDICSFLYTSPLNHQSCFFKASCFTECGLYDTELKIASDYKKFIQLAKKGYSFSHIDTIIASFDSTGISQINNELRRKESNKVISEQFTIEEINNFNIHMHSINKNNSISNLRASIKNLHIFKKMNKRIK